MLLQKERVATTLAGTLIIHIGTGDRMFPFHAKPLGGEDKTCWLYHSICKAILAKDITEVERLLLTPTNMTKALFRTMQHNYSLFWKQWLQYPGFDPGADDNAAIRYAAAEGLTLVVSLLLQDKRVDPAAMNNDAIRRAAHNNKPAVVKLLLQDRRVNPAADDNAAIRWASQNGHTSVVALLLHHERVNPAAARNYAIRWAAQTGHQSVVALLLQDKRVDPAANNNYAIWAASKNGHQSVVELLLFHPTCKLTPQNLFFYPIKYKLSAKIKDLYQRKLYESTHKYMLFTSTEARKADRLLPEITQKINQNFCLL